MPRVRDWRKEWANAVVDNGVHPYLHSSFTTTLPTHSPCNRSLLSHLIEQLMQVSWYEFSKFNWPKSKMRAIFQDFKHAHHIRSGPLLGSTIMPTAPASDPLRLRSLYYEINSTNISVSLRNGLLTPKADVRLSKTEGNAWVEVYVAYWKFLGEIVPAVENRDIQVNWSKMYEAWKEVANSLIRGYTSAGFQAWTVPCLYVAGRFLRIFAIKADESLRGSGDDGKFSSGGFQDDVVGGELGKNEKLEDSARMINRIFTLCISDRYVEENTNRFEFIRNGETLD